MLHISSFIECCENASAWIPVMPKWQIVLPMLLVFAGVALEWLSSKRSPDVLWDEKRAKK